MKDRMDRRGRVPARVAGWLLLLLAAAMFSACSKSKGEPATGGTVIETNTDPDVFAMPHPDQFPLSTAQVRNVIDEMHVTGVIAPDVNRTVPVVSLGGGRVVEIKAKLGDYVQRGKCCCSSTVPICRGVFRLPEIQGRRGTGGKAVGAR